MRTRQRSNVLPTLLPQFLKNYLSSVRDVLKIILGLGGFEGAVAILGITVLRLVRHVPRATNWQDCIYNREPLPAPLLLARLYLITLWKRRFQDAAQHEGREKGMQ
jgi:hypothetical protein